LPAVLEHGEDPDEPNVEVSLVVVSDLQAREEDEVEPNPEGQVEPLVELEPSHKVAARTVGVHKGVPLVQIRQVVEEDHSREVLEVVPPVPREQIEPEQGLEALNDQEAPVLGLANLIGANGRQHWVHFI